jgi:hypothetical protein
VAGFALMLAFCSASTVRAADDGADPPKKMRKVKRAKRMPLHVETAAPPAAPSAESRLESLSGDVSNLRKSEVDTSTAVAEVRKAIAVTTPSAGAAPTTIGEHVGALERDLADTRKNLADNLGIHIHGLVDGAYEYNLNKPNTTGGAKGGASAGGAVSRTNQLRVFDIDANSFSLEQFNLHIDRTVEGGVGFVTDLNFGKTAEIVRGATRYSNTTPGTSTDIIDPTQAYVNYTVPVGSGINLSAGKFVTLLGAEIIPVYNNFDYNESKSIIFGFGIPFTHTGLRANYVFTPQWALTMGVNNGWDDVSDNNSGKSVEGQIAWTPIDAFAMTFSSMYGPEQVNRGGSKRAIVDPVATWKTPIAGLTLAGEYMWAHEDRPVSSYVPAFSSDGNSLGPVIAHQVEWQGAAGYLIYDVSDKIEFATRGEYFRDSDGSRTGLRQTLGEITETLNYKVASGLLARLEYRHDESNRKPFFGDTPSAIPVSAGSSSTFPLTRAGQDTFEAAAIYSF